MDGALIVILALAWALVILPGALRSRRSSPIGSVGTFERAMDVLARRDNPRAGDGRVIYVPREADRLTGDRIRRRNAVIHRRRRMFLRLVAATGLALPVSALFGGRAWLLFLASAVALVVYVGLLRRWKVLSEEAADVVRRLPDVERAREVAAEPRIVTDEQLVAVGAERPYGGLQVATRPDDPWEPNTMVRIRRWDA